MALTQETILTFLLEHGGKVKNSELLSKFKEALSCSDPVEKRQNRDLFKSFVNNIAVVKVIDEVKFVVVKKKYLGFVNGNSLNAPKNEFEDSLSRLNCSFSSCSPEGVLKEGVLKKGAADTVKSVIENNNSYFTSNINAVGLGCNADENLRNNPASGGCCNLDCERQQMSPQNDKISVPKDLKPRKTGAVFAIIAVKSPPISPSNQEQLHTEVRIQEPVSQQHLQAIRITPPQIRLEKTETTSLQKGPGKKPKEWDQDNSPEIKRRQLETKLPDTPQLKRSNKTAKPSNEPKYSEGVPLEFAEHEWLVKSAAGHWDQVYGLLLRDAQLADKRDFISGFTALHWAAKDGNKDMVCKIIDVSRDRGVEVDVNARTHAGYTPLHIAAIHGHDFVIALLVRDYCANVNIRDNNGKKPYHYLHQGVSPEVRELLGDPHVSQDRVVPCERAEDDHNFPELPKGFNTLSKLFSPHTGHRKKPWHRPSFHFISDDSGDDRREHVLSRRLSEMFH